MSIPVWLVLAGQLPAMIFAGAVGWAVGHGADAATAAFNHQSVLEVETTIQTGESDWLVHEPLNRVDNDALASAFENGEGLQGYALDHGGIPANELSLRLIVSGTVDSPVIITKMEAVNVHCGTPKGPWTDLTFDKGGGATPLPLDLALANNAGPIDGIPVASADGKWRFPRQVSSANADIYDVYPAPPEAELCTFRLAIEYTLRGKDARQVVDDSGRPFEVADPGLASQTENVSDVEASAS